MHLMLTLGLAAAVVEYSHVEGAVDCDHVLLEQEVCFEDRKECLRWEVLALIRRPAVEVCTAGLGSISHDSCQPGLVVVAGVVTPWNSRWKMRFVDQDADRVENPQPSHLDGVEVPDYVCRIAYPIQLDHFLASPTDVAVVDRQHVLGMWAVNLAMAFHRLGHVSTTLAGFLGRR